MDTGGPVSMRKEIRRQKRRLWDLPQEDYLHSSQFEASSPQQQSTDNQCVAIRNADPGRHNSKLFSYQKLFLKTLKNFCTLKIYKLPQTTLLTTVVHHTMVLLKSIHTYYSSSIKFLICRSEYAKLCMMIRLSPLCNWSFNSHLNFFRLIELIIYAVLFIKNMIFIFGYKNFVTSIKASACSAVFQMCCIVHCLQYPEVFCPIDIEFKLHVVIIV